MSSLVDVLVFGGLLLLAAGFGGSYFAAAARPATADARRHGVAVLVLVLVVGLLGAAVRDQASEAIAQAGGTLVGAGVLGGLATWLYDRWRKEIRRPLPRSLGEGWGGLRRRGE